MKNSPFKTLLLAAAALTSGIAGSHAANLTWVGNNSSEWSGAGNWNGGATFAPGDAVTFNATATSKNVTITGPVAPATVTIAANTDPYTFSGTGAITSPGAIKINNSNVSFAGITVSGGAGTGIGDSGTAETFVTVGAGATFIANLQNSADGSQLSLGKTNNASTLQIENGGIARILGAGNGNGNDVNGRLYVGDAGKGKLIVDGPGSLIDITWVLRVGNGANGVGEIVVSNGARVNVLSLTGADFSTTLGYQNGKGTMTVTGRDVNTNTPSSFYAPYRLTLATDGPSSSGTINVTNGGLVESPSIYLANNDASTGVLNVSGVGSKVITGTETPSLSIGNAGSARGTANVSDFGAIVSAGDIYVCHQGTALGVLNVSSGGTVTTTGLLYIAKMSTSTGVLNISDPESKITAAGITMGNDSNARGFLNITNGARVEGGDLMSGYHGVANEMGVVSISGQNSILELTSTTSWSAVISGAANFAGGNAYGSFVSGVGASTGHLIVSNGGKMKTSATGWIIIDGGSTAAGGTLNIGSFDPAQVAVNFLSPVDGEAAAVYNARKAAAIVPAAPGILDTQGVVGLGTLQFNHTGTAGSPYYFTRDGTATGASIIIGANKASSNTAALNTLKLVHTAGYTVLTGENLDWNGTIALKGGTLEVVSTAALGKGAITFSGGKIVISGALKSGSTYSTRNFVISAPDDVSMAPGAKFLFNMTGRSTSTGALVTVSGNASSALVASGAPGGIVDLTNISALGEGTYPLLSLPGLTDAPTSFQVNGTTYEAPGGSQDSRVRALFASGIQVLPTLFVEDEILKVSVIREETFFFGSAPALAWVGAAGSGGNVWKNEDGTNAYKNWAGDNINNVAISTFLNGDTVFFTDSGVTDVVVDTAGVLPAAVIVENGTGRDYTITSDNNGTGIGDFDSNTPTTLTKRGAGTLTLFGSNSFSGNLTVEAGVLGITSGDNLGSPAGALLLGEATGTTAGTTLINTNGITVARDVVAVGAAGGIVDTNGYNAAITGSVAGTKLTKTGEGTLTLAGSTTAALDIQKGKLVAADEISGTVFVSANGVLEANAIVSGPVTLASGGTLAGVSSAVEDVTFSAGAILSPGVGATGNIGTLGIGTTNSITAFDGVIFAIDVKGATEDPLVSNDVVAVAGSAVLGVNVVDVSATTAGGVDLPVWAEGVYTILTTSGGISTTAANLAATNIRYKGVVLTPATRAWAELEIASTSLVLKTHAAASTELTWNESGTGLWSSSPGVDTDWRSGTAKLNFQNGDASVFANRTGISKSVTVDTAFGGIVTSAMTVTGTDFVFGGGKIVGLVLSSGFGAVSSSGSLVIAPTGSATFNNELDFHNITVAGTATFGSTVKTDAPITVSGTAVFTNGVSLLNASDSPETVVLSGGTAVFAWSPGVDGVFAGVSGNGSVVKQGTGRVVLNSTVGHAGTTTISGGVLSFTHAGALALSSRVLVTVPSAVLELDFSAPAVLAPEISGAGGVTIKGAEVTFDNAKSYTGTTRVDGGALNLAAANAIANSSLVSVSAGSKLTLSADQEFGTLDIAPGAIADFGQAAVSVSSGRIADTVSNVKTFSVRANASALTLSVANALSATAEVSVQNGGVLDAIANQTFATLSLSEGAVFNLGAVTLKTGAGVLAGELNGAASSTLVKTGPGVLTLTGTGTLGALAVEGGSFAIRNGASLSTTEASVVGSSAAGQAEISLSGTGSRWQNAGEISIGSGGNLAIGKGAEVISPRVNIAAGGSLLGDGVLRGQVASSGHIQIGSSHGDVSVSTTRTLTIVGELVLNAGASLSFDLFEDGVSDKLVVSSLNATRPSAAGAPGPFDFDLYLNADLDGGAYTLIESGSRISSALSDPTSAINTLINGTTLDPDSLINTNYSFSEDGKGLVVRLSIRPAPGIRNDVLTWSGLSSGTWDTSSSNWRVATGSTAGAAATFKQGDIINVNAPSGASLNISVVGTREAAGVNVAGSGNVTFSGGSIIGLKTGTLSGAAGTLVKEGDGTLAFQGNKLTFGGGTTVRGGKLALSGGTVLNSSVTIEKGGTLELGSPGSSNGGVVAGRLINNLGTIAGNGAIRASLEFINQPGGIISPGFSAGVIEIAGNFTNKGTLLLQVEADGSHDVILYSGAAPLTVGGTIQFDVSQQYLEAAGVNYILPLTDLVQNTTGAGTVSIAEDVQYTFTDPSYIILNRTPEALTLRKDIGVIPGLHKGLHGFTDALNRLDAQNDPFVRAVLDDGKNDISITAREINRASPLAFAAMTALPIATAAEATAALGVHLDGLRFARNAAGQSADTIGLTPYVFAAGSLAKNGSGNSNPVFDADIYGGAAGVDFSLSNDILAGFNIGGYLGRASLHDGGGKIKQEQLLATAYASAMFFDRIYVDGSLYGGASSYDTTRHNTGRGANSADVFGYDLGASIHVGGVLPLTGQFNLTPFAGFEFVHAEVDAFTEKSHRANNGALAVRGFSQDSLRARVGATLNWQPKWRLPVAARFSLNLAFARELLDSDVDIQARFAESSERFKVKAAALPENLFQIGPSVEFSFTPNVALSFGYTYESDLADQTAHHLNASFRMRF